MLSSLKSFPDIPLAIKYPIIVKTITTIADIIIIFTALFPFLTFVYGDTTSLLVVLLFFLSFSIYSTCFFELK